MKGIYLFFKRFFDIAASFLALVLLAIPFLIIAVVIKCTSKGPVFFRQKRVGKNKKLFTILKFRTMRVDAPRDTATHLLNNADSYITGVGKFLRKTSIDELPQIFNIFAGQMSVIGPRPALYNQYDLVELRDKYNANGVRPGLTGLAQISGRDELELEAKAKLDGEYVQKMSLWLDIKIFFKTLLSVFKSDGVVEGGTGAMAKADAKNAATDLNAANGVVDDSDPAQSETNSENSIEIPVVSDADGESSFKGEDSCGDAADSIEAARNESAKASGSDLPYGSKTAENALTQTEDKADNTGKPEATDSDCAVADKEDAALKEAEAEDVLSAFVDACCCGTDKTDGNSLKEEKDR